MKLVLITFALLLTGCNQSQRPEPTGFRDISWGTPHDAAERQLFKSSDCRWDWSGVGFTTVSCLMPMPGVGPTNDAVVSFEFGPDKTFGQYCLTADSRGTAGLRAIAHEKFGPGTVWTWRGATASYAENSRGALRAEPRPYRRDGDGEGRGREEGVEEGLVPAAAPPRGISRPSRGYPFGLST